MRNLTWKKAKSARAEYVGRYERDRAGERIFLLIARTGKHRVTFESWQAARKQGWISLR